MRGERQEREGSEEEKKELGCEGKGKEKEREW